MRGAAEEEEHGIYIPPELWRHIASFVPWRHDGAAAARRVCRAFRDGVNDTAKQLLLLLPNKQTSLRLLLPPPQYPHLAYPGAPRAPSGGDSSPWSRVLAAVYGSCMQCGAAHWWNVTCFHPDCTRVICMACRDAIDPCGAKQPPPSSRRRQLLGACCSSCSTWHCPAERRAFATCRCTQEMCPNCIVGCSECGEARCSACECDCPRTEPEDRRWEDDEDEEEEEDEDEDEEDEASSAAAEDDFVMEDATCEDGQDK